MWVAKLKIKHDSKIANRCKKFNVLCYSILLGKFVKNKIPYISGLHYVVGNEQNIKRFIKDLNADKGTKKIELKGNVFSMLEYAKIIPSVYLEPTIFFVKPVLSNRDGFEYWEIASWDKVTISDFIKNLEKSGIEVTILKIIQSKLSEIHFPIVMPQLTKNQKRALELAIETGYYDYPRKVNLDFLSKQMKIGISTFQEHIRKAERKLIMIFSKLE